MIYTREDIHFRHNHRTIIKNLNGIQNLGSNRFLNNIRKVKIVDESGRLYGCFINIYEFPCQTPLLSYKHIDGERKFYLEVKQERKSVCSLLFF